jgi:hypothetical protein
VIAALFVAKGGCYFDLEGVDPWDEVRDARLYAGPWSVVAHPPCAAWCQLAGLRQHRYGYPKGEDGGCFESALSSVRMYGGVLEHPAYSKAWKRFGLIAPRRGCWIRSFDDAGWVTEVSQAAYGHRARKRTWLYFIGGTPPGLNWSEPVTTAVVSGSHNHSRKPLGSVRVWSREAKATPPEFRDLLIGIARTAQWRAA